MGSRVWRLLNAGASEVSSRGNYLLIRYEDFVTSPEAQLRRLSNHIGLETCEAMLCPDPKDVAPIPVHRRSYQQITDARIGLWREELEPWQVAVIAASGRCGHAGVWYELRTNGATFGQMVRAAVEAVRENALEPFLRSPHSSTTFFSRPILPPNKSGQIRYGDQPAPTLAPRALSTDNTEGACL